METWTVFLVIFVTIIVTLIVAWRTNNTRNKNSQDIAPFPRSFLNWHGLYYDPELKIPFGKLGRWTYILDSPDNLQVRRVSIGFDRFYVEGKQLFGERGRDLYQLNKESGLYVAQLIATTESTRPAPLTLIPDPDAPEQVPSTQSASNTMKTYARYSAMNADLSERNRRAIKNRKKIPAHHSATNAILSERDQTATENRTRRPKRW